MRYAIFDLDGTLLDSMGIWESLDAKFLKRYGQAPTPEMHRRIKTLTVREAAQLFKIKYDLLPTVDEISSEINQLCTEEYLNHVQLKPRAREFLEYLHNKAVKMCIATAGPRTNTEQVLLRMGIIEYFDFILTGDDMKTGKDDPEIFLRCAAGFGAPPGEITVFEDALHAVKSAKKAGFRVIGVYDPSSDQDWDEIVGICDGYIKDFREAIVILTM